MADLYIGKCGTATTLAASKVQEVVVHRGDKTIFGLIGARAILPWPERAVGIHDGQAGVGHSICAVVSAGNVQISHDAYSRALVPGIWQGGGGRPSADCAGSGTAAAGTVI
jgi:hypothetical protein